MNLFKTVGRGARKVVTAPVAVAASAARFARAQKELFDVWRHAEKGERNPALYRDAGWWSQLLKECRDVYAVLPIAKETRDMVDKLKGLKSYGAGAAMAIIGAAFGLGYIDAETATALLAVVGGGGIMALRAAIAKAAANR